MNHWNSGYTTDVDYTYGYYPELSPVRARLALLDAGFDFPETATACELGFGQGISVNVHAAGSPVHWCGTDFNPAQAGFARQLAVASGAQASLHDDAFHEFMARDDLPDFDFIGLHGIWSWVSDENRKTLVDFVRRKLKVGGVLYVSYNTLPGWAAFAPMRHLLALHAEVLGAPGRGSLARVGDALGFAEKLLEAKPLYAALNGGVAQRLAKMKEQNPRYLAHEFFNRDWAPMYFSEVSEWLAAAKVEFACSANFADHVNALNLTQEQQQFLSTIEDRVFRESVRDFMVNHQFRKDYWVRGARRLSPLERMERLRAQSVVLLTAKADIKLEFSGTLKVEANEALYGALLDALSDGASHTLGQLEQSLRGKLTLAQVLEAAMLLISAGHLGVVQSSGAIQAARTHTDRLNAYLQQQARGSGDINYLASPVTGGAISAPRVHQLFLLARAQGQKSPEDWARFVWRLFSAQGGRMVVGGKKLESAEENIAELTRQAAAFQAVRLPMLEALGVA